MSTALIIEDDRDQAEMAAQLVRLKRFDPIVAETGAEGLRLTRTLKPRVLLLDLMLPDTNGFDVCKELRADRETMLTPIVMLTALNDAVHRTRGFRVGANAYVTKPYGARELFDAIEAACAWRDEMDRGRIQGEIHVQLNSETTFLREVNDLLTGLCRSTPLTSHQITQLRQAVLELGQNAIEWGNRYQLEELVDIYYRVHEDRVEIVIRDQGAGFDPTHLPHAAHPDDPVAHMDVREKLGLREGGFGLLIAKGMVDEMTYNDRGNEVTLVKRFPPPGGAEPGVRSATA
ncbi:MAG: ATP-binding protein [Isosphaeraceae bacterium]|nr:ATP-binding protein [Isosphaeraceae bacterium]